MFVTKPDNFVKCSTEAFEDYLTWCNDYERVGYAGAVEYRFRGTHHHFASVMRENGEEVVYVSPSILSPPTPVLVKDR